MDGSDYARQIQKAVYEKDLQCISNIIENLELSCCIRQYSNAKTMGIKHVSSYIRSAKSIKQDIKLFRDGLVNACNSNDMFYMGQDSIFALIIHHINPCKIPETYRWLEQVRYFFMKVEYCESRQNIDNTVNFLKTNLRIQSYLNMNHLKGLKVFFLPISCIDRFSSTFYYDSAIAIYPWIIENSISVLRTCIERIGTIYYIPTIKNDPSVNEFNLHKLKSQISDMSDNRAIEHIPDECFFADMFSLYILMSDISLITRENLREIYNLLAYNRNEILNAINLYFENIDENNSKISSPIINNIGF